MKKQKTKEQMSKVVLRPAVKESNKQTTKYKIYFQENLEDNPILLEAKFDKK